MLVCSPFAWAVKDLSSWRKYTSGKLISESQSVSPGSITNLAFQITLKPKWHTYWVNPGDSGAPPRLDFTASRGLRVVSVDLPFPERFETGPLMSFAYKDEVLFPIRLEVDSKVKPGDQLSLKLNAEWLVCEEVCIPAIDEFHLDLEVVDPDQVKPNEHFQSIQRARALVPTVVTTVPEISEEANGQVSSLIKWDLKRHWIEFFPYRNVGISTAAPKVERQGEFLHVVYEKAAASKSYEGGLGIVVYKDPGSRRLNSLGFGSAPPVWRQVNASGVWWSEWGWMLLWAWVGGLILNLMPCVFPILSIKLLSLVKLSASEPREVRIQNLLYSIGVVVSFLAIGGVIAFTQALGTSIGWGFQLQSPYFVAGLAWLFTFLSFNLLGFFELHLINANWGHQWTRMGGRSGAFFTGILAVVVASPCTAPFMGAALGFGIAQPVVVMMSVFAALGLGLASPYLTFTVWPNWIRFLPKPGQWMVRFKQISALPLLATVAWLLWILRNQRGDQVLLLGLAGCALVLLWVAILRWRRLPLSLVMVLLLGLMLGISRMSPPEGLRQTADGIWQPYSESQLAELKGQSVFVNMTADWCLTCKVNERLVFADPRVLAEFSNRGVSMLKGDWTQRNPEITRFLQKYDRVGVPFYVLFSPSHPEGLVLPEILTKNEVLNALESAVSAPVK